MRLRQLFEAPEKHVSFCFGRMNPPTIGHAEVFKTLSGIGGDYFIFVTQTQDRKENPLSYDQKINFIKAIHPQYAGHVVENSELNTVVKVASYLYEQGYKHATFVAGSDRIDQFKKLLTQYNGVEGKAHGFYDFELLDFKSSGDRDPDSPGVSGVSASKARAAAANNDFEGFQEATGAGEVAKQMFDAVRQGMGITESINENTCDWHISPSGRKTNMCPDDDDYEINYGKNAPKLKEAPIEMDPTDPMDPMIYGHDKANPAKLKYRMLRAAGQIKDLASRVDKASSSEWQTMTRQFEELKMNMEQIRHALEELGKLRKKGGIRSRGIDPMLDHIEEGYGRYWCSTDKKWKTRKGPKQKRSS